MFLIALKECLSNRVDELTSESADKQAKSKVSFSLSCLMGCGQVLLPFIVGLPASDNGIKKSPRKSVQHLGFQLHLMCSQVDNRDHPSQVAYDSALVLHPGDEC